jgi:hypothetical protein
MPGTHHIQNLQKPGVGQSGLAKAVELSPVVARSNSCHGPERTSAAVAMNHFRAIYFSG